jgi:putative ABC transport system permease protein
MRLSENNNKKVITHLAKNSIKNSKMRNFFIIITIVLSVSLLMVMSLYTIGIEKSQQRSVSNMQHVIYEKVTDEQIKAIAGDNRVDMLLLYKYGQGMEVDNKMIQPVWFSKEAIKGDGTAISTMSIMEGKEPVKMNEIGVSKEFCETMGIEPKIGVTVSLNFLDGTTEEFVISGILNIADKAKIYPILFSEEYSLKGSQLKNIFPDAMVRIHNANNLSQNEFLEVIRNIANISGVERKRVNENDIFVNTLSGGDREIQQIVTTICLGTGILFVSILVIYSVFYLSVIGRIRQFGQLRTIGMTRKQIKGLITKEGLLLCGVAIPIGILIGGIIGYLILKSGWDWRNTGIITIIVIITEVITVLLSIYKPAKIASGISPIEAAKFSGYHIVESRQTTSKLNRKLTPVNLANISGTRNRKKTVLTMISLGIGGVLFMIATTLICSTSLEEYSRQGEFRFGEFTINLSYNAIATAEHGLTDIQMDNPLNEKLKTTIEAIDGVNKVFAFEKAAISWEAHGEAEKDKITSFTKGEISEKLLESGTIDYDTMVEKNQILVCNNTMLEEIYGWKYQLGDKVNITYYNGTEEVEKEYTIVGFVNYKYYYSNTEAGWYLIPKETLHNIMNHINLTTEMIVSTEPSKQAAVESKLQELMDENPLLTMYTLREQKEIDEDSFTLLFQMIFGLSLFIIGFSMINLVNTLITNVVTRKQEFSLLQAIGMTNGQLMNMIQAEGLLLSLGNLIITLIIGVPVSYAVIELLRYFSAEYMHFTFPLWFFIGYVILIVIVPIIVSGIAMKSFKKLSLVERLRIND